jgi:Family of unknown function (DUF5519)
MWPCQEIERQNWILQEEYIYYRPFAQEITRFPDVQETRGDMFGERSFRVGGREFLHIHGPSTLHMLRSKETKAEAMARGLAHQHPCAPWSGMVELRLHKEDELTAALELAKQSYDYAIGLIRPLFRRPRMGDTAAMFRLVASDVLGEI